VAPSCGPDGSAALSIDRNRFLQHLIRADFSALSLSLAHLATPPRRVKNYERIFGSPSETEIFAKRTMASICGRMAIRAAARQNVAYTPVRFCKSKWRKAAGKSHGQLLPLSRSPIWRRFWAG